jgi:hypothetical protein
MELQESNAAFSGKLEPAFITKNTPPPEAVKNHPIEPSKKQDFFAA